MGGIRYSADKINSLISLRKEGKTIPELMEIFQMPKTSIWHHVHGLKLDTDIAQRLRSKKGGTHRRNVQAWKDSEIFAKQLLTEESADFIKAVTMLYWAEGHKKDFIFTNTDIKMLQVYVIFLLDILKVTKSCVKIMVRTSDPINSKEALAFWSKNLKLPLSCFVSNHTSLNRTKTTYGICRVMVLKSSFYHKVMISLITLVQEKLLRPCSSMDRTPHS